MSQPNWRVFHTQYTPPDHTSNSTNAIMNVKSGYLIGPIIVKTVVAFDGSNSDASLELGDGDNADEFLNAGEIDEYTAGDVALAVGDSGGSYDTVRYHLYEADDTIDATFVADTGGDGTVGTIEVWISWMRVMPH